MKRTLVKVLGALIIFGLGVFIGTKAAGGYYKSKHLMELIGYQTQQPATYAILLGNNQETRAKQLILSDLKLNLIKARHHQENLPHAMREHLCQQLLKLAEERGAIEAFAKGLPQSDASISDLLSDIEVCESW